MQIWSQRAASWSSSTFSTTAGSREAEFYSWPQNTGAHSQRSKKKIERDRDVRSGAKLKGEKRRMTGGRWKEWQGSDCCSHKQKQGINISSFTGSNVKDVSHWLFMERQTPSGNHLWGHTWECSVNHLHSFWSNLFNDSRSHSVWPEVMIARCDSC